MHKERNKPMKNEPAIILTKKKIIILFIAHMIDVISALYIGYMIRRYISRKET